MNNLISTYLTILLEENRIFRYDFDQLICEDISDEIIFKGFLNIIDESNDPNYFIKFPKELKEFTEKFNNLVLDKYDILTIFPEFENCQFPKIFVSFFDFSNKNDVEKIIKSISKLDNNKIVQILKYAFSNNEKRGMFIDLTKYGVNISFLFFNTKTYNQRTIYHEWTHIFQTYIGKDFEKLIKLNEENVLKKNKELKKFNLTFDIVQNFFFSKKEYITRLDNLIYMIHQVQKLDKYKDLSDIKFFQLFKFELCKKDLNVKLIQDILKIDKNFLIDIQFFIATYICFDGELFIKLCFDLQNRI